MFQITSNDDLNIQASESKKNQDTPDNIGDTGIDESINNLSTIMNTVKSQKSDLTNHKALQKPQPGRIFLLLEQKKPLSNYKRHLLKL